MKKTENLRDSSKLDPMIFSAFFSLLRKPAERSSADCRFGTGRVCVAVFAAAKTSGRVRRCGGAIVRPARFAEALRRSPAGVTTQAVGRPGRLCRPGARSAQKKRAETAGASLLAAVESTLFFYQPAKPAQPKTGFRVGFREGLLPKKPPP